MFGRVTQSVFGTVNKYTWRFYYNNHCIGFHSLNYYNKNDDQNDFMNGSQKARFCRLIQFSKVIIDKIKT